jgi:hypothetical protein
MKHLKMFGLAVFAAMAVAAFVGAGTASATTLEIGGVTQNTSVTIQASLEQGTSALLKDSAGTTTDTCVASSVHGSTSSPYSAATVQGALTEKENGLSFSSCSHTTKTLASGSLSISSIEGSTHGTLSSSGAEVTVVSTAFGASAVCKTGSGTHIGTLTGVKEGHATMDVNAKINCGILGTATWTAAYTVTTPTGLGVEG